MESRQAVESIFGRQAHADHGGAGESVHVEPLVYTEEVTPFLTAAEKTFAPHPYTQRTQPPGATTKQCVSATVERDQLTLLADRTR